MTTLVPWLVLAVLLAPTALSWRAVKDEMFPDHWKLWEDDMREGE